VPPNYKYTVRLFQYLTGCSQYISHRPSASSVCLGHPNTLATAVVSAGSGDAVEDLADGLDHTLSRKSELLEVRLAGRTGAEAVDADR